MLVIISILGALFSSYVVSPDLYSHGPYEFTAEFSSLEACQIDSYGTGSICTTEAPYQMYTVTEPIPRNPNSSDLIYLSCDYWAGCYTQEEQ